MPEPGRVRGAEEQQAAELEPSQAGAREQAAAAASLAAEVGSCRRSAGEARGGARARAAGMEAAQPGLAGARPSAEEQASREPVAMDEDEGGDGDVVAA
eukprot:g6332.t1